MSRRTLLGFALVATLPLAGCTSHDPNPAPTTASPRLSSALKLVAFDSCQQLRDDLRAAAKKSVGPWGFDGGINSRGAMPGGAQAPIPMAADAKAAGAPAAPAFSGTNTHEADVDEPDIVKTDGKRIVTVTDGSTLRVVDVASHRATGKLDLGPNGYSTGLLLSGDHALVLRGISQMITRRFAPPQETGVEVVLVDLAGAPRVLSRFTGQGGLVDARQTGSTARVVLSSAPRIDFRDMPNARSDQDRVEANQQAIEKAPLDAWLPEWSVTTGDVTERGQVGCGDVRRPPTYSGKSMLSVLTFDMAAAQLDNGRAVSIVADGKTVYGTPTSLYVANDQRWRLDMWRGADNRRTPQQTEIYRFATNGDQRPVFEAAGKVPGWLINQYAMSEWDGRLRVATTDENAQSSAVRVLQPDGDTLKQVGEVDGLGKGERIYSVRFIGPRGYVVTFKQTDPLYSVDLSDPTQLRVTGELKINGYSAHLQPVGDDRLIGIGQEADSKGVPLGTQVSLFDVSDPAATRRLAQQFVSHSDSEAQWDPHAILWWPATKLFVVPLMMMPTDAKPYNVSQALALTVTDDQLKPAGRIVPKQQADGFNAMVRRSMVIGNELWTLTDEGLTVSQLSTLDPITSVPFT